jgi:flagellar operon protein (TIGR03826 family)
MANLMNCPQCGKLFVKTMRDYCDVCYREEEKQYDVVYKHIRKSENRNATLVDVSEATKVPEQKIIKFIHQGRIRVKGLPNFAYPCDGCDTAICDGRLCDVCKSKIKTELSVEEFIQRKQHEVEKIRSFHTDDK